MRPGTPNFVGQRLKEAREARGLNGTSLAECLGVTKQAISQYENGTQTPGPHTMRKITEVLRLPSHFFVARPSPSDETAIFWRSHATATKSARLRAQRLYGWVREIGDFLRSYINFPAVNFPEFDLPENPGTIDDTEIEELATETRRFWGLRDGPISNVTWLIENQGAVVSRFNLEAESLDAFSQWGEIDGTPYLVLGADKHSAVRSRYNVAHELGHMILHKGIRKSLVTDTKSHPWIEGQAHRFAGAFLLPAETFTEDVPFAPTLDLFRSLKSKWKASIALMIMRSHHLGLTTTEQHQRLWINLSARKWKRHEPLDDELTPEEPRLFRRALELLIDRGVVARSEIPFRTRLPASDIEVLTGLDPGFFGDNTEYMGILRFPGTKRDTASN